MPIVSTPTIPATSFAASFPDAVASILAHYHDNLIQYIAPMEAFSKTLPARLRKRWVSALESLNTATMALLIAGEDVEDVAGDLRVTVAETAGRRKLARQQRKATA